MSKLFDENVSSLDFAEFAAAIMQAVHQNDFPAAISGVVNDSPGNWKTLTKVADGNFPDMLLMAQGTRGVAFIGGAVNLSLAQKFWQGYFRDFTGLTGNVPRNTFTESLADYVETTLTQAGLGLGAPGVFVGHSMGGTVAQSLGGRFTYRGGTSRGYYCSFGSPKWLRDDVVGQYRLVPGTRWMNDNDPIPLFPFTARDSLTTLLILPPLLQNTMAHYVQSAGGVQIDAQADTSPEVLPLNASVGNILTYPGYLLGINAQPLAGHAISLYLDRLHTAALAARQPLAAVRISTTAEAPATATSRYYTAQEQRVATAVSVKQQEQNRPTLDIPRPRAFRVFRQGRVFLVTFGEVTVALTSDRRTARSIAAQWNVALRHLQTMGYVNIENFLQQMQSYLAAASDPTSGFSPTMNTALPV